MNLVDTSKAQAWVIGAPQWWGMICFEGQLLDPMKSEAGMDVFSRIPSLLM